MPYLLGAVGTLVLIAAWCGPLPALAGHSFAAHMSLHMAVVALAAPAIACAVAGSRWDPVAYVPALFAPVLASVVELLVVWAWHAPALHHAAQHTTEGFAVEQATFFAAGVWLWLSALGGSHGEIKSARNGEHHFSDRTDAARAVLAQRRGAGVLALLLTSMHMTLLGALLALSPRLLFAHHGSGAGLSPLVDQQVGGAIMLVIGGAVYLMGGVWLTGQLLRLRKSLRSADAL